MARTPALTAPFSTAEWNELKRLERIINKWDQDDANGAIKKDDDGTFRRYHLDDYGSYTKRGPAIPDRKNKAIEKARTIAGRHGLAIFYQEDCRGRSLYVYNPANLRKGKNISHDYSMVAKVVA